MDFQSIQTALNHAQKGDTIHVSEGTYHETIQWPSTYGIQLLGDPGKTTIDAQSKGRVFYFPADLKGLIDHNTIIQGFTLKNGNPDQNTLYGGGIYCHSASPHLKQLLICDNEAHKGGGLYCFQSDVLLTHVTIVNNHAKSGGGIACDYSKPELVNVTISDNYANSGAALYAFLSTLKLHNVSIIRNMATQANTFCSAIYLNSSHLMMDYSLIWNTGTKHEVYFSMYDQPNTLTIRQSSIRKEDPFIVTNNNGTINQDSNQTKTSLSYLYLSPQSDTGIDATDNITRLDQLQLMAKGIQGNCLDIYEKGNQNPFTRTCLSNDVFSTHIYLSEGIHSIYAHPTNPSYTISQLPSAITITIDQTAPVIKELSITETQTSEKYWTFISQDDDPDLQYAYCFNQKEISEPGQNYSTTRSARIEAPDLADGKWFVHVKAIDRAGNESTVYTFTTIIDKTAPVVKIKDITENHLVQQWTWSPMQKEPGISYRFLVNQNASAKPTGPFNAITRTTLKDVNGKWYLHVQAKDRFGNLSQVVTSYVLMDNIPPKLKNLSDDPIPKKEKAWKWQSSEPGTTYRFKINKKPKYTLNEPFNNVNQARISTGDGQHYLHIQAKDKFGNISQQFSFYCVLDNTKPVVAQLVDDPKPTQAKIWQWSATDADPTLSFRFSIDQKQKSEPSNPFSHTTTASLKDKDGIWYLHVQAKDRAGNLSEVMTVSALMDNTSPIVKGLKDDLEPGQWKQWSWMSNEPDTSYRYQITQNAKASLDDIPFSSVNTAKIADKNAKVYLHVQAKDFAGNISEVVTVSALLDNSAPELRNLSDDPIPKKEKVWKWQSNENGTTYRFKINKNSKDTLNKPFKNVNQAKISNGDGRHYLHIQAKDASGNISQQFSFYCLLDNTKPVVTQLVDDPKPTQAKTWQWSATDADPTLSFRFSIDQKQKSEPSNPFSHTTTASLKDKDGIWYLHVQAKDRAGNSSNVVTVSALMDNTPPIVKGLKDDPDPKQWKQWTWMANEPETRYRYQITQNAKASLDDIPFSSVNTAKIADKNAKVYLHVQAKDIAGNISEVVTVSALLDNSAPKLTNLSDDPVPRQMKTWAWGSNEPETTYRFYLGDKLNLLLKRPFSDTNYASISKKEGKLFLHVQAKDKAGNMGEPLTVFCILDNTKPVVTGLSDDPVPTQNKVWKWSASDADPKLRYRYLIDQNKKTNLSKKFTETTTASIQGKNGIWYLHVQAQDRAGNMSKVKSVSKLLDNMSPSLTVNPPGKEKRKIWTWSAEDLNGPIQYSYRCDRNPIFLSNIFSTETSFDPIDCIFNASKEAKRLRELNGQWYFHVQAKDRALNMATITKAFNFDFTNKGLYVNLEIMFEPNTTQVKASAFKKISNLSTIMAKYPDAIVDIEAHTDNLGDEIYNLKLSERRAEAIKKYLHEHLKIPLDRLNCTGYGEAIPIADNETYEGRRKNRRAVIILKTN